MYFLHTSQSHSGSIGWKSNLFCSDLSFLNPLLVNAVPNLAVLVAKTQSNISTPNNAHTTKSTGYPTPIKYLGLSFGISSVHVSTTFQKSSFVSPPANPPIAYPGRFRLFISRTAVFLKSRSSPPWMIPNKFCSFFREWALMHLSIHRNERSQASYISFIFEVGRITSSNAIIISLPILFCICMLFSGDSIIFLSSPFIWDTNSTPCSLRTDSCAKETIWNPPLSVKIFPFQFI